MIRLTTPTHRFKFPFELDENVEKVIITYTQNRRIILEKEFVDFPGGGNTIEYTLTQTETKSFNTGAKTEVQGSALFANGKAVKSAVYELKIKGSLRQDIINTDAPETETEFSIVEGEPRECGCFCDMNMEFDMDMELGIKGDKGDPGEPGLTPYIGENGNWYVGQRDTGVKAAGTDGHTPVKGVDYFTEAEISEIEDNAAEKAFDSLPEWAKSETKPTYTATEVGADAAGTAASLVGAEATAREAAVSGINAKISTSASSTNKLVSESEMGDAISAVEAKQLYATASQGSFDTKAALTSATVFYNADGTVATPTKNDVSYVLADESHDGKSAKYVIASVDPAIVWGFVIAFSDTTFTQEQMNAINSGATAAKIGGYDSHVANSEIHVTSTEKSAWSGKYSKPSGGIPKTDLASAVQTSLGLADSALQSFTESDPIFSASAASGITSSNIAAWNAKGTYSKPSTGIPKADMASAVQTSLGKADSAYQKPSGGIPASDLASGVIPTVPTALSQLSADSSHRTVTDTEKSTWNGKENAGKITISGVEKTATTHTVTITNNGVTTTLTLVGVS